MGFTVGVQIQAGQLLLRLNLEAKLITHFHTVVKYLCGARIAQSV
jgi:hypothetical protein